MLAATAIVPFYWTDTGMPQGDRPPEEDYGLPASVECPFCRDSDTQLENPFGSVLSVAQYYCRRCRTMFEWVKRNSGQPKTDS